MMPITGLAGGVGVSSCGSSTGGILVFYLFLRPSSGSGSERWPSHVRTSLLLKQNGG